LINRPVFVAAFFLCFIQMLSAQKQKVWIDTDIMIGKMGKDVDDGLALILALKNNKINIRGISLVHGVDYGAKVTQKILSYYGQGQNISVYKGAQSRAFLGKSNEAVEALATQLKKEKLTLIALGQATNIATLLQLYPGLESQITEIIFCMGRRPNMHFRPGNKKNNFSDYNFDLDPDAMEFILNTDIKITLSCYEASVYVYLGKEDIKVFKNTGFEGDKWLYHQLRPWVRVWRIFIGSKKGFVPWDAITIGSVLTPQYFDYEKSIPVQIRKLPNDSKFINKAPMKPYLLVSSDFTNEKRVNYCYKTSPEYKSYLLKTLPGKPSD